MKRQYLLIFSWILFTNLKKAEAVPQYVVDYNFGSSQVERMMKDRPKMGLLVHKDDRVYSWAARQFGGAACGQKIYWNNQKLDKAVKSEYLAENQFPTKDRLGFIRVKQFASDGKELSSEQLWECAIFELINISFGQKYLALSSEAITHKYTKEKYILEATKLEYEVSKNTIGFYYYLWLPNIKQNQVSIGTIKAWPTVPSTYQDWIRQFTSKQGYPWDSWGQYYDDILKPLIKQKSAANTQ